MAEKEKKTAHKISPEVQLEIDDDLLKSLQHLVRCKHSKNSSEVVETRTQRIRVTHNIKDAFTQIHLFLERASINLSTYISQHPYNRDLIIEILTGSSKNCSEYHGVIMKNLKKTNTLQNTFLFAWGPGANSRKEKALTKMHEVIMKPYNEALHVLTRIKERLCLDTYELNEKIDAKLPHIIAIHMAHIANHYLSAEDREKVMQILEGEFS